MQEERKETSSRAKPATKRISQGQEHTNQVSKSINMMNIRAIFVLLSSLGAVIFLSPEPTMRRINNEIILVEAAPIRNPVESAKKATGDVVQTASDYAKHTGEGIRHRLSDAGGAARTRVHQASDSAARARDAAESRVHAARDAAESRAHQTYDTAESRAHQAYDSAGHSAGSRIHQAYDEVRDSAAWARDSAGSRVHEAIEDSRESLAAAAAKARERSGEYVSSGRDRLGDSAHALGDSAHALGLKNHHEDQSALGKLKERVQGAVQYQPNLGQGVGYVPADDEQHDNYLKRRSEEAAEKMEDYLEGARSSARDAMQKAAEGLELLRNQLEEPEPHEEHPSIEKARGRIREYYDTTKNAVLSALNKKEQQLGRSLDSAKKYVELHYEKAKESSLESIESQKEMLGQYLDMVRMKLNGGREAVYNYAVNTLQHGKEAVIDEKNKLRDKVQEMEEEALRWKSNAQDKVNETLKQAGRWAHDQMVKINETEEVAKRWMHKTVAMVVRLLHLFVFSSVFGSALWVTFVSGFVLSRNISRQQFGLIQSKIFPVYFRMIGSGITLLLATHTILHPVPNVGLSELLQYYNLAACLALTLLNTFVLEPRVTKSMFEKLRLEKEEGRGVDAGQVPVIDDQTREKLVSVGKRLHTLHSSSSAANLAVLAGLTWHLWYLNCRLVI